MSERPAALTAALQRLTDAIEGERKDWHTVEVRPYDLVLAIGAALAPSQPVLREALDALDAIDTTGDRIYIIRGVKAAKAILRAALSHPTSSPEDKE